MSCPSPFEPKELADARKKLEVVSGNSAVARYVLGGSLAHITRSVVQTDTAAFDAGLGIYLRELPDTVAVGIKKNNSYKKLTHHLKEQLGKGNSSTEVAFIEGKGDDNKVKALIDNHLDSSFVSRYTFSQQECVVSLSG